MTLICRFCKKRFEKDEDALKHIIAECGIKNKDEYWKWLVKYSSEVLVDIADGKLPSLNELNLDQYRAVLLLYALRLIKVNIGLTHEEVEHLLAAYAPEVYIYLLEYVGVIEITKNGKVKLKEGGK